MSGNGEFNERLQRLEDTCSDIPQIKKTLAKIEGELIGDEFGNRRSFKGRLEDVEDTTEDHEKRIIDVERSQKKIIGAAAGGAGVVSAIVTYLKKFIFN